ncbi:MAG: DUF2202 domain-containing protein [Kofleriaceae bacterium]
MTVALSDAEIDSLQFMREEEKLARDVYAKLEQHGYVFQRIGGAEQRHFDAVARLLDRFRLPDPAVGAKSGVFRNPSRQALYAELVARGTRSELDALAVGLEIEELDIHDLERARAIVRHPEIAFVYDQLQRASRNHVRAFHRRLTVLGGSYAPRHLEPAKFEEIAGSETERGPGRGHHAN